MDNLDGWMFAYLQNGLTDIEKNLAKMENIHGTMLLIFVLILCHVKSRAKTSICEFSYTLNTFVCLQVAVDTCVA